MPDDDGEVIRIAREIQRYLETRPDAADTLAGIVKWWLLRQRLEEASGKVQKALDYLVVHGIVRKKTIAGGAVLYSSLSCEPGVT